MDLFFARPSGNSARAVFGLLEAGATWTPHVVNSRAGENREAAYLAINPMGKVPALRDGAFLLWESNAINWYVAEAHPAAQLLPASAEGRAGVQRWLMFQTGHVTPACAQIFRTTNERMRAAWNAKADHAAAEAGRRELERYLPVMDAALAGREWLEETFSLADIAYAPHFALIAEGGFEFSRWPRAAEWLGRLLARPMWRRAEQMALSD